jgi:hypothetical protein
LLSAPAPTCASELKKGKARTKKKIAGKIAPSAAALRMQGRGDANMNATMKTMTMMLATTVSACAGEITTEDVIARLVESDQTRQAQMGSLSYLCRYKLENKNRRAEMLVSWTRGADGEKRYVILSETGDGGVRSHVFHKLVEAEVEASKPAERGRARITPDNYDFRLVGRDTVGDREAYVLELEPKIQAKYLTRGRIWVDARDFAVIRVEGAPSRNVSFWTKKVDFVQTFEKNGPFWLASSNHSVTDARFFGLADLTLEYFNYELQPAPQRMAKIQETPAARNATRAALNPHMPWTPPPGGVEDEQR